MKINISLKTKHTKQKRGKCRIQNIRHFTCRWVLFLLALFRKRTHDNKYITENKAHQAEARKFPGRKYPAFYALLLGALYFCIFLYKSCAIYLLKGCRRTEAHSQKAIHNNNHAIENKAHQAGVRKISDILCPALYAQLLGVPYFYTSVIKNSI